MICQGLCTFPHGKGSIYIFITAISAYLFAISASWGCYFVEVDVTLSSRRANGNNIIEGASAGFGLFSYEDGLEDRDGLDYICYAYTDEQLDNLGDTFKAARAMALLSNIFIGLSMILIVCMCCVQFHSGALTCIGIITMVGGVFQFCTFVVFGSDLCSIGSCDFWIGAGFGIVAALLSFVTGIVAMCLPAAVDPFLTEERMVAPEPFEPGTVTETETVMPDGSTKITRTQVNEDGSKTIEETVYEPN